MLGQGKTTLNPHCQPGRNFRQPGPEDDTRHGSLDHLSSLREIIYAILSALHGRLSLLSVLSLHKLKYAINDAPLI